MIRTLRFTFYLTLLLNFGVKASEEIHQVDSLRIHILDGIVVLNWAKCPFATSEPVIYQIKRTTLSEIQYFTTSDTFYVEPLSGVTALFEVTYSIYIDDNNSEAVVIEDFETGNIQLFSYSVSQDREPNAWNIDSIRTYQNSDYSLRVYGNTWKMQILSSLQAVAYNTMWGVAIYTYTVSSVPSEICAFGLGDGVNELFYTFWGSELADSVNWRTTYNWVGGQNVWRFDYLPVGVDWYNAFGYEPNIDRLFYINDEDGVYSNGGIYFDYICDITEDMPQPPVLTVDFEVAPITDSPGMTIQFLAEAIDPDSDTLFFHWDFSDGTFSEEQNPIHTFPYMGSFSVQAEVHDSTMLYDRQAIELVVPIGTAFAEITANFTGDVMMGRRYEEPGGIIPTLGANVIWEPTLNILGGGADLTFINSECTYTTDTSQPHPTKEYVFFSNPNNINALNFAGVDGVSLANNHTMDYMEPGLTETMFVLDTAGIKRCGSGMNDYDAMQPMVHYCNGISIGTLGYCNRTGREGNLPPFLEAGPNKAGFAWFNEYYLEQTIPQAAQLYDIIVAQVHCGIEYDTTPDTTTGGDGGENKLWMDLPVEFDDSTSLELQYLALDLGADVVIAHHPHVLQGFEVYNGKLIAHSLGNFVFDQDYFETYPTIILYAEMSSQEIFKYYFKPIFIDDYIPGEATGELGKAIIDRMADYSKQLNTTVIPDYDNDKAYIALHEYDVIPVKLPYSGVAVFPDSNSIDPAISLPMEIYYDGFIYSVEPIPISSGPFYVRFGREMLWVGNFENEGATLWNLNSPAEIIDSVFTIEGFGALRINCNAYQSATSTVNLEDRFTLSHNNPFSVFGYVKGINADHATINMLYYTSRLSGGPIGIETAFGPTTGTFDWTPFCFDLTIPGNGNYGNIELSNSPPFDDQGYVWFDEIKLIKWDDEWYQIPVEIPVPNNYRFLQIRGSAGADQEILVNYTLNKYDLKPFDNGLQ